MDAEALPLRVEEEVEACLPAEEPLMEEPLMEEPPMEIESAS